MRLKTHFFHFCDAYNFIREHRRELGDPSFFLEFFALSDDYILKRLSQVPRALDFGALWFFVKLSEQNFFRDFGLYCFQ